MRLGLFVILIFIIFELDFIIYFKRINDELRAEVKATRKWCIDIIDKLVDQEIKINKMFAKVLNNIDYNTEDDNTEIVNNIKDIQEQQNDMVQEAIEKSKKFPYTGEE